MRKFEVPYMSIQRLAKEDVLTESGPCFETFACTACYCSLVQCPDGYKCTGLVCGSLSDFD